jgi:hypothetical protein
MLTHPSFEAQAPETSDIYTHDLVPFMPEHTPLILACHMALPIVQQLVALPRTAALPNSTSRLPCRIPWCPVPKNAPRLDSNLPLIIAHKMCANARFVPIGTLNLHCSADSLYNEFYGGCHGPLFLMVCFNHLVDCQSPFVIFFSLLYTFYRKLNLLSTY